MKKTKKKLPFHVMVSFAFLGGLVLCLLVLNLACGVLLRPVFEGATRSQMAKYGHQLESMVSEQESDEVDKLLSEIYDGYLIRGTILDEEGTIQHTTDVFSRKKTISIMEEMVNEFEEQGENPYFSVYQEDGEDPATIYFVQKTSGDRYIIMNRSIQGIAQNVKIVSVFLVLAGLAAAVVGMTVWALATKPFSDSMEQMSSATQRLANLDFSQKVDYHGSIEEIVVLADSIDNLSEQLEESLREMNQELERRKALLRNLAHEIKTPLTTIRGYTENMEIVTGGNQRAARYCQIILEECSALDLLATEMMEVSTLEGSTEFYEMVELDAEFLSQIYQRRIQREFPQCGISVQMGKGKLRANPHLLERVVFNYVGNAVRYRTEGTPITLVGQQNENGYCISVSNYGPQLSLEEQKNIWDAFYKGDKSRTRSGSYGVGLSIVRQVAVMQKATAGVESRDGVNTFYFQLPKCN